LQRYCELERRFVVTLCQEECESGAKIRVLRGEQPGHVPRCAGRCASAERPTSPVQWFGALGLADELGCVAPACALGLTAGLQLLQRELLHGLQHGEARLIIADDSIALAHEALVD
jgi:hypothetical protein